jgi:hypothetical protein
MWRFVILANMSVSLSHGLSILGGGMRLRHTHVCRLVPVDLRRHVLYNVLLPFTFRVGLGGHHWLSGFPAADRLVVDLRHTSEQSSPAPQDLTSTLCVCSLHALHFARSMPMHGRLKGSALACLRVSH